MTLVTIPDALLAFHLGITRGTATSPGVLAERLPGPVPVMPTGAQLA